MNSIFIIHLAQSFKWTIIFFPKSSLLWFHWNCCNKMSMVLKFNTDLDAFGNYVLRFIRDVHELIVKRLAHTIRTNGTERWQIRAQKTITPNGHERRISIAPYCFCLDLVKIVVVFRFLGCRTRRTHPNTLNITRQRHNRVIRIRAGMIGVCRCALVVFMLVFAAVRCRRFTCHIHNAPKSVLNVNIIEKVKTILGKCKEMD